MKKPIVLLLILSLANPSWAGLIEHADHVQKSEQSSGRPTSLWEKVTKKAEKKIDEWWNKLQSAIGSDDNKDKPTRGVASVADTEKQPTETGTTHDKQQTPHVKSEEQHTFAEIIDQTEQELNSKETIELASPGRAGDASLAKTKAGVPTLPLSKTEKTKSGKNKVVKINVDKVPLLDVGVERSIKKSDLMFSNQKVGLTLRDKPKELDSPKPYSQKEILKLKQRPLPVVTKAKPPVSKDVELGSMVSAKKIADVPLDMKETRPLTDLLPVKLINDDDFRMLTAVVIYEKGDQCHLASGLFHLTANIPKFAEESNFYLGICAHQMGFHTEAVQRLIKVIQSENPDFTSEAIANIVENLPAEYDDKVMGTLLGIKKQSLIPEKAKDSYHFVLGRALNAAKRYEEAAAHAIQVSEKSKHYMHAQYLLGIAQYSSKNAKKAEETLLKLRQWMAKKSVSDKNMEALIAVNIARIQFTQGRYEAAHQEYLSVPKDHSIWVDALVEQGWAQLNIKDAAGAIGNMYSLHSPYFKSVFLPESWVIRTLGYIDLCQYGDAYKSLTRLEQMYSSWLTKVKKYREGNRPGSAYYQTVKSYIKGRSDQDVDGLPAQVIREIGRQRGFLNAQNALNVLQDEIAQYDFIYGIIRKDQRTVAGKIAAAKARLAEYNANLEKAKKNAEFAKNVNEWLAGTRNEKSLITSYEYMAKVYEDSRKGYLDMKKKSLARIESDKNKLRTVAGKELMTHLKDVQARIEYILEGNEFLRYEIFSGSGENIRYQVTGGKTEETKRIPSYVKPQKILNWEFDGEYWEDEIGSYRSTLKNNCPNQRGTAGATIQAEGSEKTKNL